MKSTSRRLGTGEAVILIAEYLVMTDQQADRQLAHNERGAVADYLDTDTVGGPQDRFTLAA